MVVAQNNFLVPNGTFIAEVIGFLIVLGVLWRYVLPPIRKAIEQRQETVRQQLEDAQRAKEALERSEADQEEVLADARQEAARIREAAREDGQKVLDRMRRQAQEEAQRIVDSAQEQIDANRQEAQTQLRAEVSELAVDLATRLVGESLGDDGRQRRLVERYIDELNAEPAGASAARAP